MLVSILHDENELYVIIQYKDNTNVEQKVDFGINCYKKIAAKTQKMSILYQ